MLISGLRGFINQLEASGHLLHFQKELLTKHEIPAAIRYIAKREKKALFFDKVKGYDIPVVGNLFGSKELLSIAFQVRPEELENTYIERAQKPIKPILVTSDAPVHEVEIRGELDLMEIMPLLIHHARDAGAYMTSAITVAKDPETGIQGMGIHRIQVKDRGKIGIFLATPPLSDFFAKAEKMGKPLDIAVVSGVDPWTFCASVSSVPQGHSKFDIAGAYAQRPLELTKCRSVDLEVPANAEFVLEGHILPHVREQEGPFGESTGYYFTFDNPVGEIEVVTHRSHPIYHALMPFSREEEVLVDVMTRPNMLQMLQEAVPEITVLNLALMATGEFCTVQIAKKNDDDAQKVIDCLLPHYHTKIVAVIDNDVDISEPTEIAWAICTRIQPHRDVNIRPDLPGLMIDPSVGSLSRHDLGLLTGQTSKIGIDATKPLDDSERFDRVNVPRDIEAMIIDLLEVVK